jgi:quercetin dioxygenase-like cupin family protein
MSVLQKGSDSVQQTAEAGEAERTPDEVDPDTPRTIVNPLSGERIVIRQSSAQTHGELLAFDLYLPPGGHVPAGHAHPVQEERFFVVAGVMRFRVRGATVIAQAGEVVVVPPGTAHWFGNAGPGVAQARVEVRPALRMEEVLEAGAAMQPIAAIFGVRLPRLRALARFLLDFQRELAVPHVPPVVTRVALTPLARLRRHRNPRRQ